MNKLIVPVIISFIISMVIPNQSKAITVTSHPSLKAAKTIDSTEARVLLDRLQEINAMDKSNLSPQEKKALRKEVRSIKSHISGGVYLSGSAVIIILLLLLILF